MRGHVQTSGRERPRAGPWLVVLAAVLTATAHADGPSEPGAALTSADPIDLAANRIRVWDADGAQWASLEGRVAVLQLPEVVRADAAIVRITGEAGSTRHVEVYAEGRTSISGPGSRVRPSARKTFTTDVGVNFKPYPPAELIRLPGPPSGVRLLAQGFPGTQVTTPRPETVTPPDDGSVGPPSVDPMVRQAQVDGDGFPGELPGLSVPADDMPPVVEGPAEAPTDLAPFPNGDPVIVPPTTGGDTGQNVVLPYTQRSYTISPRDSPDTVQFESAQASDGTWVLVYRGGINLLAFDSQNGTVDISCDNLVLWVEQPAPGQGQTTQDAQRRFEVYMEGNVLLRQDKRTVAGNGDQSALKADRLYFDFRTERKIAHNAEINFYAPGLLAPVRTVAPEIQQFTPPTMRDGKVVFTGPSLIRAESPTTTGSRFPWPGYRFSSQSVDLYQVEQPLSEPSTGLFVDPPRDPAGRKELIWRVDARQNFYFLGPVPIFYWPRVVADSDDLDPPLTNITYRYGNYFGHQIGLDFSVFKLLNLKKPHFIDAWNLDVDFLSERGVGVGSEIGWFGRDVLGDIRDPYYRDKSRGNVDQPYFGYLDLWGIRDRGIDVLGAGPAVVTDGPLAAGRRGFQRIAVPHFQDFRGRFNVRHMQSLLGPDALDDEDFRLQLEAAYLSDRNFLEQYYKRLFDSGLDQTTLAYLIRQRENRAFTVLAEANLHDFDTETQWFPRLDYYRLGDALFGGRLRHSSHSGIDYANTHTAIEVNNPNIFAFLPYDPVSNTSGPLRTGRAYTGHELQLPLKFDFLRVTPYAQGQLVGWDNQLGNETIGRAWGALGARANVMAWRAFPGVESELLNIHGLNHKLNFVADYRTAYSNVDVDHLAVQDDLDDNPYEYTRRYFALTNYVGGVLPPQYDPRLLTLRRGVSPIAGTVDVQDDLHTLRLGVHQRLQTKRGPEGRRRIIDYMIFDFDTTYFPNAERDNFGKSFGQNMYNYEWYVGDRTSILVNGWFEFFPIDGRPILLATPRHTNDPLGLNVVNTGLSISRPPRGNVYIGYSIIDTGPIATSAVVAAYSYWLSPKWYSTFSTTYDFGNAILLGSTVSVTRIGADFLTSLGLSVDPQRENYTFAFELVPRFSPNVRFGSVPTTQRIDVRYAPSQ